MSNTSPQPQNPAPQYPAPSPQPQNPAPQYAAPPYSAPQHPGQPYPGQQYAPPAGYPAAGAYAPKPPTNVLAIIALISAFVVPIVAPIVLGHISLGQIRRSGEEGRGFAIAALVLGYLELAAVAVSIVVFIIVMASLATMQR